jgi:hypothetical protein
MTHLRSLISKEDTSSSEYKIDDIDNPNGWDWKELDWLFGMGFVPEGETRLQYNHSKGKHQNVQSIQLKITIYKDKRGYWLIMNDRRHVFRTFIDMINHIDKYGAVEV